MVSQQEENKKIFSFGELKEKISNALSYLVYQDGQAQESAEAIKSGLFVYVGLTALRDAVYLFFGKMSLFVDVFHELLKKMSTVYNSFQLYLDEFRTIFNMYEFDWSIFSENICYNVFGIMIVLFFFYLMWNLLGFMWKLPVRMWKLISSWFKEICYLCLMIYFFMTTTLSVDFFQKNDVSHATFLVLDDELREFYPFLLLVILFEFYKREKVLMTYIEYLFYFNPQQIFYSIMHMANHIHLFQFLVLHAKIPYTLRIIHASLITYCVERLYESVLKSIDEYKIPYYGILIAANLYVTYKKVPQDDNTQIVDTNITTLWSLLPSQFYTVIEGFVEWKYSEQIRYYFLISVMFVLGGFNFPFVVMNSLKSFFV